MGVPISIERNVESRMRDGTILKADVYHRGEERRQVLLTRTPYGKDFAVSAYVIGAVERGYTVVIQDTRGRWSSAGETIPMLPEKEDGYDSVQWAADLPWSNGQVGMFGGSYVAYTQWAAAAARPPALRTIIPAIAFSDPYSMLYQGGSLALGVALSWGLLAQAQMTIINLPLDESQKARLWGQFIQLVDGMASGESFRAQPLSTMPLIGGGGIAPFFAEVLAHPERDAFWERVRCPVQANPLPAFHIGGWYDIFIRSTLADFTTLQNQTEEPWIGKQQKLLIGPWTHGSFEGYNGEVDFGLSASWMTVLPEESQLNWFDYWLRGVENGTNQEPPVQIFVMGANRWRSAQTWPLPEVQEQNLYLHSAGAANSLSGNGSLSQAVPGEEPLDTFVYDPHDPTPTRGGGLCCWQAALQAGPFDQRSIEERMDVLVYSTQPLERDLEVIGTVRLRLWAATSARDTDFTAKLVDVRPDGYARNIQDGILRLQARNPGTPSPVEPGQVYELEIEIGPTANRFLAGHQLRLEIASSNFPRFARNPNTGELPGEAAQLLPAVQSIFHDSQRPSHLILPVIPGQ